MANQDDEIRTRWPSESTSVIARVLGMPERTVRWRAARLGLPTHPRGRRRRSLPIADTQAATPMPLPITRAERPVPRATLPQDYVPFRPGEAPAPQIRRDP